MLGERPHHHVALSLCVALLTQAAPLLLLPPHAAGAWLESAAGLTVALTAAGTYAARGTCFPRQTLATLLAVAWGVRLSWYLSRRNLDSGLPARRLALARVLWTAAASLPVVAVNALQAEPTRVGADELCGAAAAAAGALIEAVADEQKARWHNGRVNRPSPSDAEPPVCATGLWRLSRHPNLFGEALFHAGLAALVARVVPLPVLIAPAALVYWTALSAAGPRASLERQKATLFSAYPRYIDYAHSTSPFVPMPPTLYQRLLTATR